MAVDQGLPPSSIRVFLRVSKCDQFRRGVAVFVGATTDELYPVAAIIKYVTARGGPRRPLLPPARRHSSHQGPVYQWRTSGSDPGGHPLPALFRPQLPNWRGDRGKPSKRVGFHHPSIGPVVQRGLPSLHPHPKKPVSPVLTRPGGTTLSLPTNHCVALSMLRFADIHVS